MFLGEGSGEGSLGGGVEWWGLWWIGFGWSKGGDGGGLGFGWSKGGGVRGVMGVRVMMEAAEGFRGGGDVVGECEWREWGLV